MMKTKMLVLILALVLIVAGSVTGAYYYLTMNRPSAETQEPTPSPPIVSPTQTQTGTQTVAPAPSSSASFTPAPTSEPTATVFPTSASSSTPTLAPTSILTPSATDSAPDPYFPSEDYSVHIDYNSMGVATGGSVSVEVANRGGAGDAFVKVEWESKGQISTLVFHMDKEERVLLEAYFAGIRASNQHDEFKWTTRAALPSDKSQGQITVTRSTIGKLGSYDIGPVLDITLEGNIAYVIVGTWNPYVQQENTTLHVLDVSNPAQPHEMGRYILGHKPSAFSEYHIAITGHYACVIIGHQEPQDKENGLYLFDVSDAPNIKETSHLAIGTYDPSTNIGDRPYKFALFGNYAYVITNNGGSETQLLAIDVSNPSSPRETGRYKLDSGPLYDGITVKNNLCYVVGHYRLSILNISRPNQPEKIADYSYAIANMHPGFQEKIAFSNNYAFIARIDSALMILDVSNPSNPAKMSEWFSNTDNILDIAVSGNYVYAVTSKGLVVVDASNPLNPKEVGSHIGITEGGRHIAEAGNYVYTAGDGLNIYLKKSP